MGIDQHGRTIDYLRISVTDRCNLRCVYCMPLEGVSFKPHAAMLSYDEIVRLVTIAAGEGFSHIRLTGGEPLVRKDITGLVRALCATKGIERVAMTTNGILLPKFARELREAGLSRVNISLDTLDATQYNKITRLGSIDAVFDGISAALTVGFNPVKLNCVVIRSQNPDLLGFVKLTIDRPLHVRFIEYMPLGGSNEPSGIGWTRSDTIPNEELIAIINEQAAKANLGKLNAMGSSNKPEGWGPARYFQLDGAKGTVGFISALSRHFCTECNRLRLTADGMLRPCLFSDQEFDVRAALRAHDDDRVRQILAAALDSKPDEHHHRVGTYRQMSQIGG